MKTIKSKSFFSGKFLPIVITLFFSAIILVSCDKDDDNVVNNNPYSISGTATGSQVLPAVSDTGTATITGTYNPVNMLLTYSTNWNNLSGAPISGGFYNGAAGASGTMVGSGWSFDSTATGTGSVSDTLTLTADQASQLLAGNWYYTYGTANNPAGEVRGQITASR
jgi:CHRD domain